VVAISKISFNLEINITTFDFYLSFSFYFTCKGTINVIQTMIRISIETAVDDILTTTTIGNYVLSTILINFLFIDIISGQKRSYSDYNARGGGGARGTNIVVHSCMSIFELQKLTIHTG
jgi:hypothetical protein